MPIWQREQYSKCHDCQVILLHYLHWCQIEIMTRHRQKSIMSFIGMYEMMQMEVLKVDSVITDISVAIPKLCDSRPALLNWIYENATEENI